MSRMDIWWSLRRARSVFRVTRWWRDSRSRLVSIYVALVVLRYAIPAIFGELDYPNGTAGLTVAALVDGLLIVLIARGSRTAVVVALVLNAGFLLSATVVASDDELVRANTLAYVGAVVAQCVVLVLLLLRRGTASAALRA
jgi:hypothetical protein